MDFKEYWRRVQTKKQTRIFFDELPVLISALGYSLAIGLITYVHDGFQLALISFLWQLPYTYVASKVVFYSAKYFASQIDQRFWAYFFAVTVPTLFSLVGTYAVQLYIVGVSNPLPTLLPTLLTTPFTTFGWAKVQRLLRHAPTSKKNNFF